MADDLKPFIDLRQILELSGIVVSVAGLFINFLLLYLILRKTGLKLKNYQKILLQNCIIDIIYNVVTALIRAQTDFKDGNFFVIVTSSYGPLSFFTTDFMISGYLSTVFLCVTSLPVQFIHRYYFIVKSINLTRKQYFIMLIIATVIPLSYGFTFFWFMQPSQEIIDETSKLLYNDPYFYKKDLNFVVKNIQHWKLISLISWVVIMSNGAYCIVLWTSYKVWKHLKVMECHMSSQTKNAHHQMTVAMIAQAIIPLIFSLFPVFINVACVILHINVNGLGVASSLIFCWIPVANSLTTILVVKHYRNFILGILKRILCMHNNTSSNNTTSQLSILAKTKIISTVKK